MQPFEARSIRPLGLHRHDGWVLKRYAILYGVEPFVEAHFEPGLDLALAALPMPAVADGRPGVGFVILHRGRTGDYLVLGWWDHENELPLRVFVRRGGDASWRPAAGGESVCVWDLQVIAFERDAYVATVLAPRPTADPLDDYLGRSLTVGRD